MNQEHIFSSMRRLDAHMDKKVEAKKWIRTAVVTNVRKKDGKVRVLLLPEGIKTGYIRVYWLNTYGSGQLPKVNATVLVLSEHGHPDGSIVLAGAFGDDRTEPTDEEEIGFIDKFGNQIIMNSNGVKVKSSTKVIVDSPTVELAGEGGKELATKDFVTTTFMLHVHTGGVLPGALTGPPGPTTVPLPGVDYTIKTKAN